MLAVTESDRSVERQQVRASRAMAAQGPDAARQMESLAGWAVRHYRSGHTALPVGILASLASGITPAAGVDRRDDSAHLSPASGHRGSTHLEVCHADVAQSCLGH